VVNYLKPDSEVRRIGEFDTVEEAITTAQKIVDEFLSRSFKPGMDAKSLFSLYKRQGEYPFIFRDDDMSVNVPGFEHSHYAKDRAAEVCSGKK
ncbi:MAG TPA: hypothetical protein VKD28_18845, partial [Gemmatimonadales bacterium]|nr:hypothetical protein [Gemmatimonadales bacterium]